MKRSETFMILVAGLLLVLILVSVIHSRADSVDKEMCTDAGLSWVMTDEGVECVSDDD